MTELLLGTRRRRSALIDIDFSRQSVGDTNIVDRGTLGADYLRSRTNVATPTDGVKNIPGGLGRGYYFDGGVLFDGSKLLGLTGKHYRVTARMLAQPPTSTLMVAFATGYYPNLQTLRPGMAMSLGQFQSQYYQYFLANSGGAYQRVLLNGGRSPGVVDEIVIERRNGYAISNRRTSQTNTYGEFEPNESYWIIGNDHTHNYPFTGYLLSLRVELI